MLPQAISCFGTVSDQNFQKSCTNLYMGSLNVYIILQAELQGLTSPEASGSEDSLLNMTNDDKFVH